MSERTHKLKTWPKFFKAVKDRLKTFECRLNDRDFKVGDILELQEWNPLTKQYTEETLSRRVTYILYGGQFGIEKGWCVMGIEPASHDPGS